MPKRKTASPEEIIKKQRKTIRILFLALIVVAVLAALLAYPAITHLIETDETLIGQNYSVIQELLPGEEGE